jgi:hypothetical protein
VLPIPVRLVAAALSASGWVVTNDIVLPLSRRVDTRSRVNTTRH